jgi:hypothetical protein
MKTLLFAFCILCASVVWGQTTLSAPALSAEPQPLQFRDHPEHADQLGMAREQRIMERSLNISAHGTRPLWEFAPVSQEIPLGDIARAFRQEHETARKAEHVLDK